MTTVRRSRRLDLPTDEIWRRIGDFHALAAWHPGVAASEPAEGGRVRRLTSVAGTTAVETLLEEGARSYTYRYDSGRLPVRDYVATLRAVEEGDGCAVEWEARFEPTAPDAEKRVAAVFEAGLAAL